jgi:uncharacterized membrane protein YhhN
VYMSVSNLQKSSHQSLQNKPLRRTQQYLVELRVCTTLLKDWLLEVKELTVVLALIAFFVWGVIQLFKSLH